MTRTVWTSALAVICLAGSALAQGDGDYMILDEVSIEGEVREPSVEIISSRLEPILSTFRLEKSFLAKLKTPDSRIVSLNPGIRLEKRITDPGPLLDRQRFLVRSTVSVPVEPSSQSEE
jgi:hypothetical protein